MTVAPAWLTSRTTLAESLRSGYLAGNTTFQWCDWRWCQLQSERARNAERERRLDPRTGERVARRPRSERARATAAVEEIRIGGYLTC